MIYILCITIIFTGLAGIIINNDNLKRLMCLTIFQSGIICLFIALSKTAGSKSPILKCLDSKLCPEFYTNPLPHVLMLTAIVVGLATTAVCVFYNKETN